MQAAVIHDFGDPDVFEMTTVPRPEPLPTELLVRVHAAGVNPLDWRTRAGFPTPVRHALGRPPHILGWDVAGVVEAVGDGEHLFSVGQEVFGLLWLPRQAGAYAQFVTAPSRQFARTPAGLDHVHAAAVPLAGLTAWQALTELAHLKAGERVLIHAAAGGVGHLAVQIAKHLGAHVTATASRGNHDFVLALGADEVIDYRTTPFEDAATDIDVVLDLVGMAQSDTSTRSLQVMRAGGRFVSVAPGKFSPEFSDHAEAGGIVVIPGLLVEPDGHGLSELAHLIEVGALQVHVEHTYDLANVAQAHRDGETGRTRGKLVLRVP
jgi:NADPH:quinone reductase-like Zn-dependent oxidoreductase